MFEEFIFTNEQINRYFAAAKEDLKIAADSDIPEVRFRFSYDASIKLAITICAVHGLRVKARRGHHAELITKLSQYLSDDDAAAVVDDMRKRRNKNLYGGGSLISAKNADEYLVWVQKFFRQGENYLSAKRPRLV